MTSFKGILILILITFQPFGFCRDNQYGYRNKHNKRASPSQSNYQQVINPISYTPSSTPGVVYMQSRGTVAGPNQPSVATAVRTNGFVTIPSRPSPQVLPSLLPYQQTEINYVGVGPDGSPLISIRPVAAQPQTPQQQVQNHPKPKSQNYPQNQGQTFVQNQGQTFAQNQGQAYSKSQGEIHPQSQSQAFSQHKSSISPRSKGKVQSSLQQGNTPPPRVAKKLPTSQIVPSRKNNRPIYFGKQQVQSYIRNMFPYSKLPKNKPAKLNIPVKRLSYYSSV